MIENTQYKCLKCNDILEVIPSLRKVTTCACEVLKLTVNGNNHKIEGNFGDYYCINPKKRIIIGDRIKVVTIETILDGCYAEIYHWEKIDTVE